MNELQREIEENDRLQKEKELEVNIYPSPFLTKANLIFLTLKMNRYPKVL